MRFNRLPWLLLACAPMLLLSCVRSRTTGNPEAMIMSGLLVTRSARSYPLRSERLSGFPAEVRKTAAYRQRPLRHGYSDTRYTYAVQEVAQGGVTTDCATRRVVVRLTLETIVPEASNATKFTSREKAEFNQFFHGTLRHEKRHDSTLVNAALAFLVEATAGDARGTPIVRRTRADCQKALGARLQRENRRLDSLTRHGIDDAATLVFSRWP